MKAKESASQRRVTGLDSDFIYFKIPTVSVDTTKVAYAKKKIHPVKMEINKTVSSKTKPIFKKPA